MIGTSVMLSLYTDRQLRNVLAWWVGWTVQSMKRSIAIHLSHRIKLSLFLLACWSLKEEMEGTYAIHTLMLGILFCSSFGFGLR